MPVGQATEAAEEEDEFNSFVQAVLASSIPILMLC